MSRDLTDALSKLFIKLGGKLSDSKENKGPVDYIDDITDIVEPGGGGGGSDSLTVTFTQSEDGESYTCDKSYNDIRTAVENGKMVIGHYHVLYNDGHYYTFIHGNADDNMNPQFHFITSTAMEIEGSLIYSETKEILSIDGNDEVYHTGMHITYDASGDIW